MPDTFVVFPMYSLCSYLCGYSIASSLCNSRPVSWLFANSRLGPCQFPLIALYSLECSKFEHKNAREPRDWRHEGWGLLLNEGHSSVRISGVAILTTYNRRCLPTQCLSSDNVWSGSVGRPLARLCTVHRRNSTKKTSCGPDHHDIPGETAMVMIVLGIELVAGA